MGDEVETYDLSNVTIKAFTKERKRLKKNRKKQLEATVNLKKGKKKRDPFPGEAPVPEEKKEKYRRTDQVKSGDIVTSVQRAKFRQLEKQYENAAKQTARSELLNAEASGFLEADDGENTYDISQHQLANAVDITSATKYFDLDLPQFGPYRMNYTRTGRHLLMGGRKGHVAAMDWQTKKLMCEMNVMETVQDVQWLHNETMFAIAQKQWTYIYDNQGIELHCLKMLDQVLRLDFLPYHFLLVSANARGYLSYIDVSVGKSTDQKIGYTTGLGRLDVMCVNPNNGFVHLGHSGGTVTLWTPNMKEARVKMLCHGSGTRSIAVDNTGNYMMTSGLDRKLKVWDLRAYKELHAYKIAAGASRLAFSQRGLLAASINNIVEVYKDPRETVLKAPYMSHRLRHGGAHDLQFCPYEDVLGVGHNNGFTSLLVPGSGEPNFDALEVNPYQSKKQRQEAEVKQLLEKVQPDMITLDTTALGKVDEATLQEKLDEKKKLMYIKPKKVEFEPKYKKKGRNKTGRLENRKKGVKYERKQAEIKEALKQKKKLLKEDGATKTKTEGYSVFNRFKKSSA